MNNSIAPVHAQLALRPGSDDLALVYPWVDEVMAPLNLPQELMFRVHLVLEEAVTNAALHGFANDQSGRLWLELTATATEIVAVLSDDGEPFDPLTQAPPSQVPTSLEEAGVGGLGLRLIRANCRRLSYRWTGTANELTMAFDTTVSR